MEIVHFVWRKSFSFFQGNNWISVFSTMQKSKDHALLLCPVCDAFKVVHTVPKAYRQWQHTPLLLPLLLTSVKPCCQEQLKPRRALHNASVASFHRTTITKHTSFDSVTIDFQVTPTKTSKACIVSFRGLSYFINWCDTMSWLHHKIIDSDNVAVTFFANRWLKTA